jgi:hypothetical protein
MEVKKQGKVMEAGKAGGVKWYTKSEFFTCFISVFKLFAH